MTTYEEEQIQNIISNSEQLKKYEPIVYEILNKKDSGEINEEEMLREINELNLGEGFWFLLLFKTLNTHKKGEKDENFTSTTK